MSSFMSGSISLAVITNGIGYTKSGELGKEMKVNTVANFHKGCC